MKKFLAVLLAMCLSLGMTSLAYANDITPYTIFGPDDRAIITNTKDDPYNAVCNLTITYTNGEVRYGTGFMVSDRNVATAGHVLYDSTQGGWAKSITIVPGDKVGTRPFSPIIANYSTSQFTVVTAWKNDRDPDSDYGVISLNNSVSDRIGYFNLDSPSDYELENLDISISGYDYISRNQYLSMGTLNNATSERLIFHVDTLSGMSGSPIYDSRDNVIGIYNYGAGGDNLPDSSTKQNWGRRMTSAIESFLLTDYTRARNVDPNVASSH